MKILLVVMRQTCMGSYHLPVGIGYVSASLKRAGHDVVVLNPNHYVEDLADLLEAAIRCHQPQVVATGGMAFHLADAALIAAKARQWLPQATIVLGGPLVSNQPELALQTIPEADFGVIGEGEHTAVELMAALAGGISPATVNGLIFRSPTQPGELTRTPPRPVETELDRLPWVDYEGLGLDIYAGLHRPGECAPALVLNAETRVMPLITSRGCPYPCTFCCHEAAGRRYRVRSLDDVFAEIQSAIKRFRINALFIYDDLFCLKRSRLVEFCTRIAPLGLRWECSLSTGQIDPEILKLMKESGCCCISVGIESMSPVVLASMKKNTTREASERAMSQIYAAEIGLWSNLIFGDPAETLETVTDSLEWYANHSEYNFRTANIGYHPGSRIYDDAVARGLITDPTDYLLHGDCEINATQMSAAEFKTARLLISRTQASFGYAGKLVELSSLATGAIRFRCLCPHCGRDAISEIASWQPGNQFNQNCPHCNRGYRPPVVVRLAPPAALAQPLSALQQALEEWSRPPSLWRRVAQLAASGGRHGDAQNIRDICRRILTQDPMNVTAWLALARLLDAEDKAPQAAAMHEMAILCDPYNPLLFEQMAARLEAMNLPLPSTKYVRKAAHLRKVGVTQTTFINIDASPNDRERYIAQRYTWMDESAKIASFLGGQVATAAG